MATLIYNLELSEPVTAIEDAHNFDAIMVHIFWYGKPLNRHLLINSRREVGPRRLLTEIIPKYSYDIAKQTSSSTYKDETDNLVDNLEKLLATEFDIDAKNSETTASEKLMASIVICTLNRSQDLDKCLSQLTQHKAITPFEVIVVNNNPTDEKTKAVAEKYALVYVPEKRRGVSYARNAGVLAAKGNVIVYVDDDVIVKEGWLDALVAPLQDPTVMGVTGAVLPLDLNNESAELFEDYGGLFRGFVTRKFSPDNYFQGKRCVETWHIGATANAAFRAEVFKNPAIGPFNEALGTGSPTGCSEDTYLFYKILKAGYSIVYQPEALVYHNHRQSMASLRKQLYNYSKGHIAYHLVTLLNDKDVRVLRYLLLSLPKRSLRRILNSRRGYSFYPEKLIWIELWGYLNGPFALLQSKRRVKKLGATTAKDVELAQAKNLEIYG